MPSLSRRREIDLRSDRLESEIRVSELGKINKTSKGLPYCENCQRPFEEASIYCPRCDKKTMGYIREIPSQYIEEAKRNELKRARSRLNG